MKTTRGKRIQQLMGYSKMDLAIMLADTEFACEVLSQPTRKKAIEVWDKYTKKNSVNRISVHR